MIKIEEYQASSMKRQSSEKLDMINFFVRLNMPFSDVPCEQPHETLDAAMALVVLTYNQQKIVSPVSASISTGTAGDSSSISKLRIKRTLNLNQWIITDTKYTIDIQ